jgi:hypothetical protein
VLDVAGVPVVGQKLVEGEQGEDDLDVEAQREVESGLSAVGCFVLCSLPIKS